MRAARGLMLAGALACGSVASAVDDAGRYATLGVGQASCHQFTTADATSALHFKHYLLGYLTAYNALASGTYHATGRSTTRDNLGWLADYCAANPMHSYEQAIRELVLARDGERYTSDPRTEAGWGRPRGAPSVTQPQEP